MIRSLLGIGVVQAEVNMDTFGSVVTPIISYIVYPIIELVFGVAVLVFVYGIIQLIVHGSDEDGRKKGQAMMTYGIIGLFIMISAWGIIYLVSNTVFHLSGN